jgi:cellobiose phosphorylase
VRLLDQRSKPAVAPKAPSSTHAGLLPQIAILSNGSYCVMITDSGAGYSTWRKFDVFRWREDATRDCWGQFCYIRDLASNRKWSIGKQPLPHPRGIYEHVFYADRAEFHCLAEDIDIHWSVSAASELDAEVRSLKVSNTSGHERHLEFTSFSEVCLNNRRADRAHPAFAKLFIETEFDERSGALIARRRPRQASEFPLLGVHVSASDQQQTSVTYETDRLRFLGRGRTARTL